METNQFSRGAINFPTDGTRGIWGWKSVTPLWNVEWKTQILLPVDNLKSGTNSLLRVTGQMSWVEALATDSKRL